MADSQVSTSTTKDHLSSKSDVSPQFDLTNLPTVFVLPSHLPSDELHNAEEELSRLGAPLTYDIREASLVLGVVSKPRRAKFELQSRKVQFQDFAPERSDPGDDLSHRSLSETDSKVLPYKKRKLKGRAKSPAKSSSSIEERDVTTSSDTQAEIEIVTEPVHKHPLSHTSLPSTGSSSIPAAIKECSPPPFESRHLVNKIKVVRLDWLTDSLRLGKPQTLAPYIVYEAERLAPDPQSSPPDPLVKKLNETISTRKSPSLSRDTEEPQGILERAKAEAAAKEHRRAQIEGGAQRLFSRRRIDPSTRAKNRSGSDRVVQPPKLLRQTTSEFDEGLHSSLPPMPDWVLQNKIYSCERITPADSPNDAFISQLKKIKVARLLTNDEIGVRAYSTSIASIAAYPYPISNSREILALPGCDQKIASLFREWHDRDGRLQAVVDIEADPALKVLHLFYDIWGVGATTARDFYYNKKWQDLDDVVEYGWHSLSRVQQIGVKYYDEFQLKMPRPEVEYIASIVESHAKKVVDDRIQCIIVGGYRRGKSASGDVDVILSHPEQSATAGLVDKVVRSLEKEDWITHTLTLNLTNTKREQNTLPYVSNIKGPGFDTLDKALVVWQDQPHPAKVDSGKPKPKNSNPHRRVDIIISPWRTVGCAVAGWTSGTTFQRDLRRYAKRVKGWKFDSSGVRERGSGRWIDLERWTNPKTRCTDWREAERRVFEGLGLEFVEPWDRCTG
ncbi:MAG: hypothetical protein LQ351_005447 [Letrouitia transgressa]|nr:MAG: hypothetical protein LQ351_005447 [Letrouitia transgressa]